MKAGICHSTVFHGNEHCSIVPFGNVVWPEEFSEVTNWMGGGPMKRLRFIQDRTVGERLIEEAKQARERAEQLPIGEERNALLKKARQADVAAHIEDWLNSPGLKSPT